MDTKYIKYKNKYLELKYVKNTINMIGGRLCSEENKQEFTNVDDIMKYMKNESDCVDKNTTKNKYIVILFGPPGSGKTQAFSEACNLISTYYDENKEIEGTFINTGLDDLVNRTHVKEYPDKTIKQVLIDNLANLIKSKMSDSKQDRKQIIQDNISDFYSRKSDKDMRGQFDIYSLGRNAIDPISSLLLWFAVYKNKNILFETSSGNFEYVDMIVNMVRWYGYNPVIIYPYIDNLDTLYHRILDRALVEGRFLEKQIVKSKMENSIMSFNNKIKEYKALESIKIENIIIASYDNTTRKPEEPIKHNNLIVIKDGKYSANNTTELK
jgi:hypothetical protein